jgi:hypothetical protein
MRPIDFLLGAWLAAYVAAAGAESIEIGYFSKARPGQELPAGWTRYVLGRPERITEYDLVERDGRTVLRARADGSLAAVIHRLHADPRRTPWLRWSWRVEDVLARADMLTRRGDDFAARVYVLFDYDEGKLPLFERVKIAAARLVYGDPIPVAALCYVWDNRQPPGFTAWSAYTSRLRIIVARSGPDQVGRWVDESHDVAGDFRRAFGEAPPPIAAIVLAVDTDNTRERATSYFGDVTLGSSP